MELKMKNFNILDVHWGSSQKTDIEAELPKKGGFGQFEDLRGELGKKERGNVFDGFFLPRRTLN